MHTSIKESPNPEAKILLEMGEEIEQFLRAKGFDPMQVEPTIDRTADEYVLYIHDLLETPKIDLSFQYVLPHSNDTDQQGPDVYVALGFAGSDGGGSGPRLIMHCCCREKKFSLDRSDILDEETPAADRMEDRLLQIAHKQGYKEPWSLPEAVGIQMMQEIIAYAKRSKRKEARPRRRKLRPTK